MADYIATGAGDATYNGTYVETGTHGGYPAYTNGAKWIWGNGTTWYTETNLGNTASPGYIKAEVIATPPIGLWDSANATNPPFSLALASVGHTPGRMIAAFLRGGL